VERTAHIRPQFQTCGNFVAARALHREASSELKRILNRMCETRSSRRSAEICELDAMFVFPEAP
jgi:hypothetical protein